MENSSLGINADLQQQVPFTHESTPVVSMGSLPPRARGTCRRKPVGRLHDRATQPGGPVRDLRPAARMVPSHPNVPGTLGNRPGDPDGGDLPGVELPSPGSPTTQATVGVHSMEPQVLCLRLRPGGRQHLGRLSPGGRQAPRVAASLSRRRGFRRLVHGPHREASQDRQVICARALPRLPRGCRRILTRNPPRQAVVDRCGASSSATRRALPRSTRPLPGTSGSQSLVVAVLACRANAGIGERWPPAHGSQSLPKARYSGSFAGSLRFPPVLPRAFATARDREAFLRRVRRGALLRRWSSRAKARASSRFATSPSR